MSEPTAEDLLTFAGVLETFVATQRMAAIGETRKQRIMVARHVGDQNVSYEVVVDEGVDAKEIFRIIEPLDGAIDRLKAKAELSDHYVRIANACNLIETATKKLIEMREDYRKTNAERNANRRSPIIFTAQQAAGMEGQVSSIKDLWAQIAGHQEAAAECRRVLDGEDPFGVIEGQIAKRLDALRGARPDAA
jgi:hypothetical protein